MPYSFWITCGKKERRTKLKFHVWFSWLSEMSGSIFYNRIRRVFVCKCFASLCCGYCGAAPVPYVQDSVLNPPDTYIGSATVLPDTCMFWKITLTLTSYFFIHCVILVNILIKLQCISTTEKLNTLIVITMWKQCCRCICNNNL